MNKGLDALEKIDHTICLNLNNKTLQFNLDKYEDCDCKDIREFCDCYEVIENELKDYQEIKEIAKHYNWDDITSKIFNVETDEKYRHLFNSAIVNIQEDYRKARALEIIKTKRVDVRAFIEILEKGWTWEQYMEEENDENTGGHQFSNDRLTQEEFNLLKEVSL